VRVAADRKRKLDVAAASQREDERQETAKREAARRLQQSVLDAQTRASKPAPERKKASGPKPKAKSSPAKGKPASLPEDPNLGFLGS
jgi:hypothetical protein